MKHLIWMAMALWLALGTHAFGAEAPKVLEPPKPPAKVNEDGQPWVAVDQVPAFERAHKIPEKVAAVRQESPTLRKLRLGANAPTLKDVTQRYLILDSPLLKDPKEPFNDLYQPVRFMHMKHAEVVGDCLTCHHYRPEAAEASETTRCAACHQQAFDPAMPQRLGLKAAFHQQCMDCHQKQAKGPLDCIDCHAKNVPDHKDLVKLPDKPADHRDPRMPALPQRPGRGHAQLGLLALARAIAPHRGPGGRGGGKRQGHQHGQQFLYRPALQLATVHELPCRLRVEGRQL